MAYDSNKLVKLGQLKTLAERITTDYTKKTDFDLLSSRVEGLVTAGGEPNVLEGVKVNGTALEIVEKVVDILIATGTADGTIAVNGTDVAVKSLDTIKSTLDTLVGADTGKSARTIANEELAAQLIPEDAKDSLNTLQEIADWIQDHPDDAAAINTAITAIQAVLAGIGTDETYTTVLGAIDAKIAAAMEGIAEDATKVEASETNGNIKINGEETTVYTHPAHTGAASGLYKVTVDNEGHVSATAPVEKADITGLGIPAQDTTYQKATADADGLMSKEHFFKVEGIAAGATKVEASATPGNIKINGSETPVVTIATDPEVAEMLTEVFGAQE